VLNDGKQIAAAVRDIEPNAIRRHTGAMRSQILYLGIYLTFDPITQGRSVSLQFLPRLYLRLRHFASPARQRPGAAGGTNIQVVGRLLP
jgi:hypothetical protein